jgi:tetratricopeptide (TPR) repeat protein
MDADTVLAQLLDGSDSAVGLAEPLPDDIAAVVVERLKEEADRHWWINANRSLEIAELIVQIGEARGDTLQMALGIMARGDALKFLGQIEEAWRTLQWAGDLFRSGSDEVGWARTRIGRLLICVDLNCVAEALADAGYARDIFTRHNECEKLLRLDFNTAVVHKLLGDQRRALTLYHSALATAESLGVAGQDYFGLLCTNIGNVYDLLGDFRQASAYHERARALFIERNETRAIAVAEINLAHIAMAQGHYRHALHLLHRGHDLKVAEHLPLDAAHVKRDMVECYLLLNRYPEARELAYQVIAAYKEFGATYNKALTMLYLATAEAELSNFSAAQAALDLAESIFVSLSATAWVATTQLRRGRIALQQGDFAVAEREALAGARYFKPVGQQVDYAISTLLFGQTRAASGDLPAAAQAGTTALCIAQRCNVPPLRYTSHLLLGRVAEAQGDLTRAARRYRAAAATVERVQRSLTITLRPGFLEDKGEALRALIALHLRTGHAERAFETLERAKSQVLLGYLANHEQLRWSSDDDHSRLLIEELDQLRAEHQWFYRLAHGYPGAEDERAKIVQPEQALAELAIRERRMRIITEKLYLLSGEDSPGISVSTPPLNRIQKSLDEDTLLVEFYNDGMHLWAFTVDAHTLDVHPLPTAVGALDRLLAQLLVNFAAAVHAGPNTPVSRSLDGLAQRILQRLYASLIEPLVRRVYGHSRLIMVPYGSLHYLPFHLLNIGTESLINRHEIVVQPAASLVTRRGPVRKGGALVLAHSQDGLLPQTLSEAKVVQSLVGGDIYFDGAANRAVLQAQPRQILHIAAHGEHRLDLPDLSYIQLADGQLYTDDLLQHDLSYELVTLSACETGRTNVAAGDEPIGLGRGFLYAGAGALITSLWRVADNWAVALMEHLYRELATGASKAAALRNAQRTICTEQPDLHPAFWGAFQLVGDPHRLSTNLGLEP